MLGYLVVYMQGRVVRKPVNANPGLKVNRSIHFSFIQMFFSAFV